MAGSNESANIMAGSLRRIWRNAGAPTDGVAGTYAAIAEKGDLLIYTTNAIENLNRQFRKVTKTTGVFPHDDSLVKLLWLAQADIAQRWSFVIRGWGEAMAQLSILFPDRVHF